MKRAAYDVSTTANLEGGHMDCLVPGRQNERRKPVSLKFLTKNVTKKLFYILKQKNIKKLFYILKHKKPNLT